MLVKAQPCRETVTWQYEYYLKDHLGNIRVRFADQDLDGAVAVGEVLGEHHYYGFGMEMGGGWNAGDDEARHRFNSIERNESLGLDLAPFRSYDPSMGRWLQVDPIFKFYESGYASMANNPILFPDPLGLDTISPNILPEATVVAPDESQSITPADMKPVNSTSGGNHTIPVPSPSTQSNQTKTPNAGVALDILSAIPVNTFYYDELTKVLTSLSFHGNFQDVHVWESTCMGKGSGVTLPGFGIVVHSGGSTDFDLMAHEYGHFLQYKIVGFTSFYLHIGVQSLTSTLIPGNKHNTFWTETWANYLSQKYFARIGVNWNHPDCPAKNISWWRRMIFYLPNPI